MGLQNQLSDVSSESTIIIMVVLIAKSVRYLRSALFTIVRALGIYIPSPYDAVGSGLAGVTLLCEQMNLNRVRSYASQSDGSDCVVCLSRMCGGDHVRTLACRHVFHKDCLDGWLAHMNFTCPLCRAPMVKEGHVEQARRRVAGDLLAWFPLQ
ncbi:E3 ubiquitin-protein ligase rha2a [Phtheirospermum japonicum]|uniref:E3 ubiquitin-protein ligase rha2a n=1 Tax=Phtheirospermum japonicum TaxID=374723 RepID=A0A830CXQ0_9LAMI|nr:E3 ubiquitin-protein ligase rha2a [Phtheirospermum japonicum]